jgi:hypothetical protein
MIIDRMKTCGVVMHGPTIREPWSVLSMLARHETLHYSSIGLVRIGPDVSRALTPV